MRFYTYDIETFSNCFLVSVKSLETKVIKSFVIWDEGYRNDLNAIVQFFSSRTRYFIGYNSIYYDNQMINFLIRNYQRLSTLSLENLLQEIYTQNNKCILGRDATYKYDNFFGSVDLMNVIRVGMNTKSLKMVAVNLKWPLILDMPLSVTDTILQKDFPLLLKYNINDVDITEALFHHINMTGQKEMGAIDMRIGVSRNYGVNVISESDSGMGLKIFENIYCKKVGINPYRLKDLRGKKTIVEFKDVISKKIRFKTPEMKKFLDELKTVYATKDTRFKRIIHIKDTYYTLAKGGLHSEHKVGDVPGKKRVPKRRGYTEHTKVHEAVGEERIIDADVTSYYPYIVINEHIAPEHLDGGAFVWTMQTLITDRVKAKKEGDDIKAYAMKIGANSCFGRFGFEHSWLYDLDALYGVTLNGELFLLMLIEALEENGISVFYANTDGITFKVKNKQQEALAMEICKKWEKYTNFSLDFSYFKKFFIRDVNNYLVIKEGGGTKKKGDFEPFQYSTPMKSFDAPVIAHAVSNHLINGDDIVKTITEWKDPLDFCMAQKIGNNYSGVVLETLIPETGALKREKLNRINRYLISTRGGSLYKVKREEVNGVLTESLESMMGTAGHLVLLLNDYDEMKKAYPNGFPINYSYYIRKAKEQVHFFLHGEMSLGDASGTPI